MKFRGDLLTQTPRIAIIHDKETDTYKMKLTRPVTIELEIPSGNEAFSRQMKEKRTSRTSLRTIALEVIGSQQKPELHLKLNLKEMERVARAITCAFDEEHGMNVTVKFSGFTGDTRPTKK
jgi:hypothetical protein